MNVIKLVNCINKTCKNIISPAFNLKEQNGGNDFYHFTVEGASNAVNRFDMSPASVKVINWFENFWLYFEIKFFIEKKKIERKIESQINICISLSVFQGLDSDNKKNQLFRAEWDDYNNPKKEHAQPHWHITSSQAIENIIEAYASISNESDFFQMLEKERQNVIDVKKIHFAMNGDWQNGKTQTHKIENEQQVVKWLQGMLYYLREELGSPKFSMGG